MALDESKTCLAEKDANQTDTSTGQMKVLGVVAAPAAAGVSIMSPPFKLLFWLEPERKSW